jgi:O-acetyl-ADP-ribose deacetylase
MRKSVLDVYVDVITEEEALHGLLVAPGDHVAFIGAGVSKEAGVPLADEISSDIRRQLETERPGGGSDEWAREYLNWDDDSRRYGTSLERWGQSAQDRVDYFRSILKGKRPSFSHHALTLLMAHDRLHGTAFTTNFDKLLEMSFTEQNLRECQAIRMEEEAEFWGQERDKCYAFKLHGDYDTHNILNTRAEVRSIPDFFLDAARQILRGRGLLVLGSAGNEPSILDFMHKLLSSEDMRMLSRGVRWGVYVGPHRPAEPSAKDSIDAVVHALENGSMNRKLVELLGDMNDKHGDRRPCSVFPLWGTSDFLLRLVGGAKDTGLDESARLLLDHNQRITTLFRSQGVRPEAVEQHLKQLADAQARLERGTSVDLSPQVSLEVPIPTGDFRLVYGDITGPALLREAAAHGHRAAVVSPEDTLLSAGGGVALTLADKAGLRTTLNELSKLAPISHGTAAVTSGGNLPVHYVVHAAALEIDVDGNYHVSTETVESAVRDCLAKAASLGVERILFPLLGAGVARLSPEESLEAIVRAVLAAGPTGFQGQVSVVIFDERALDRDVARATVTKCMNGKAAAPDPVALTGP